MLYKDAITQAMTNASKKKGVVFLGEGIVNAGRVYGTMDKVPVSKCIEMPICENLISGCGIGLAIEGHRPIVVYQRMDFMLLAVDSILNHLHPIPIMSGGQIKLPVIYRAIIGSNDPKFDVGMQHKKHLGYIFEHFLKVVYLTTKSDINQVYTTALKEKNPTLIIEYYDMYKKEME